MFVFFPAVKGCQGDYDVFSVQVGMNDLSTSFIFDDPSLPIEARSQRELNILRARKFQKYLEDNPKDFITGAVIGTVDDTAEFIPLDNPFVANLGVLKIPASMVIVLADGQHRQKGISLYSQEVGDFEKNQTLPVVLYRAHTTQRKQQIFTDINANPVKPSSSLAMTFDHRSGFTNFVKELITAVPDLHGCIDFEKSSVGSKSYRLWPLVSFKKFCSNLTGLSESAFESELTNADQKAIIINVVKSFFEGLHNLPYWSDMILRRSMIAHIRENYVVSHAVFLEAIGLWGRQLLEHFNELGEQRWDLMQKLSDVDVSKQAFLGRCITAQRTIQKNQFGIRSTASLICKLTHVPTSIVMDEAEAFITKESV